MMSRGLQKNAVEIAKKEKLVMNDVARCESFAYYSIFLA